MSVKGTIIFGGAPKFDINTRLLPLMLFSGLRQGRIELFNLPPKGQCRGWAEGTGSNQQWEKGAY